MAYSSTFLGNIPITPHFNCEVFYTNGGFGLNSRYGSGWYSFSGMFVRKSIVHGFEIKFYYVE